jgi:hypothetical protein
MDGMKLDEAYRQKNGLGPAAPEPKTAPGKEPEYKRFDAADVRDDPPPALVSEAENDGPVDKAISEPEKPAADGFIDKVLQEKDAQKAKKVKPPKVPKPPKPPKVPKAPKAKPALKPRLIEKPEQPPLRQNRPAAPQAASAAKPAKEAKSASSKSRSSQVIAVGKAVIFVAVVVFSLYNYLEVQRLNDLLSTETGQQSQNEAKNKELINTISAFRLLPDGEYEIYTVKDKSKLINDPVFDQAENGDKVVVYPSNSLTIVYRESEGKIVGESKSSRLTDK